MSALLLDNPNSRAGRCFPPTPLTPGLSSFHQRLPGWAPTPTVSSPALAAALGVREAHLKLELGRLGLPSFKIVGAAWAAYRLLEQWVGTFETWETVDDIRRQVARRREVTLVTATDGNHGRAVARTARLFGAKALVLVPDDIAASRVDAIRSEGATVVSVPGSYDDAVDAAHGRASDDHLVVSDTAVTPEDTSPQLVIEGYAAIFEELDAQLTHRPDVVFVQMGVGSLAAAAVRHFRGRDSRTRIIGVEPSDAACCTLSATTGELQLVPGPHRSVMAGLNCGRPSLAAWPEVLTGIDAFVTIDDDAAGWALRLLAAEGLDVGESGAAGVAAALALAADDSLANAVPNAADARALFLITEGPTDPRSFEAAVGRGPRAAST